MAVHDLFSKRQRAARGDVPDVYRYDEIPESLRVQIIHILGDAVGENAYSRDRISELFQNVHDALIREYGLMRLTNATGWKSSVFKFILETPDYEKVLDTLETALLYIGAVVTETNWLRPKMKYEAAVAELNTRFREAGVGYQYVSKQIVRVDSELIHSEVVTPVLQLLSAPEYAGANQEFLKAHEHFRHGRFEEANVDSLKALESTLKSICVKRNWTFNENGTAKHLLEAVFTNGLIPTYLQAEFTALRSSLESGVPAVRNKQGGHGTGAVPRVVPDYLAAYLIHLTATSILLVVTAEQALPL